MRGKHTYKSQAAEREKRVGLKRKRERDAKEEGRKISMRKGAI